MSDQPEFNSTKNEITKAGKFWGGFFLISFTVTAIVFLFAFWPDRIPEIHENTEGKYDFTLFAVKLLPSCDSVTADTSQTVKVATTAVKTDEKAKVDTTITKTTEVNSRKKQQPGQHNKNAKSPCACPTSDCATQCTTIDLNTIFLILVAITGFLGNMVHIATSLTTFVGNENFKRSWTMWYIVKPFTASALAIIMYFIIRAGFLSYGSDARNVSLYGILSLAALTGLFTDIATLKLKEIFETAFRPKDMRDDKLTPFSIDAIIPEILVRGVNNLSLKGKGFVGKKLTIKIAGIDMVNLVTAFDTISFSYTVADTVAAGTQLQLSVFDESNVEIFRKQLTVHVQ